MKVIIVEDEYSATQNMLAMLKELSIDITILACLESIEETVKWINKNHNPDLAFFDIELTDGTSFEIFELTNVDFPVVFTTAYSEYALKAFKVNSIDYILKPIRKKDLEFATTKYNSLYPQHPSTINTEFLQVLQNINQQLLRSYKETLLIKKHNGFKPISTTDFALFFIDNGVVFGLTYQMEKFVLDENLDELEKQLNPKEFIRANRQFILSRLSIKEVKHQTNGRLSIQLTASPFQQISISKAKVPKFKEWLSQ